MSYNAGDLKWGDATLGEPSGQITWSYDLSSGLSYNSGSYDLSDFEAALQSAFDAWEVVANIDFVYSTASSVDVDVIMGALPGSTVGQAAYSYYESGAIDTIFDATITMDSEEYWSPQGSDGLDFFAVALHEIGHVLGLGHVNDTSEIMNPYISTDVLGDGDIAGVQLLYGAGDGEVTPDPDPAPADTSMLSDGGGGGGGGAVGALVGLLALIFGAIFGGGFGAAAIAAAQAGPEDEDEDTPADEDDHAEDGILLSDLLPVVESDPHPFFASEEDWLLSGHDEEDEVLALF